MNTKRCMRKIVSFTLAFAMLLGMGEGVVVRKAEATDTHYVYETLECPKTGSDSEKVTVTLTGELNSDNKVENVFASSISRIENITITIPKQMENCDIISVGANNSSGTDSFIKNSNVGNGIVVKFASDSAVTRINDYFGFNHSDIDLILPMSVKNVGSNVLMGSGTGNIIESDSLYLKFADSEYNGVKFKGFRYSTAGEIFKGNNLELSTLAEELGSCKFSFNYAGDEKDSVKEPTGGLLSTYGYLYKKVDSTHNNNSVELSALPTRSNYTFSGYEYKSSEAAEGVKIFGTDKKYIQNAVEQAIGSSDVTTPVETSLASIVGGEVTLTAKWSTNKYKITYSGGNNVSGSMSQQELDYGEMGTLSENTFSKTGYSFGGWEVTSGKDNVDNATYEDKASITIYGDITLTAIWNPLDYVLSFNSNTSSLSGGTLSGEMSNTAVTYGKDEVLPECKYSYTGYHFTGWSTSASGTEKYTKLSQVISQAVTGSDGTKTITLYAIWEANSYTVRFYDYDGTYIDKGVNVGSPDATIVAPTKTRTGYEFNGWAYTNGGTVVYEVKDGKETTITDAVEDGETLNLYASYSSISYSISYLPLDELDMGSMGKDWYLYDTTYPVISTCKYSRVGYKFVGWSTKQLPVQSEDSTTTNLRNITDYYVDNLPYETNKNLYTEGSDYTLYPVWQKAKYTITYNYNVPNTSAVVPTSDLVKTYTYGQTVTLPNLTLSGRTFKGWLDDQNNIVKQVSSTQTGNLTFTALWDDQYIVRTSGTSIQSMSCSSGAIVTNGAQTGKTFKTGDTLSNIRIATSEGNLITSYTISEDGGSTKLSGQIANPAREISVSGSYTFSNKNLLVEVGVKANTYKITYNLDGGLITGNYATSYTYGTEVTLPTAVTKSGYIFYGWKNSAGNIVKTISKTQTGDITLTAAWDDPSINDLPAGATVRASVNAKYLTVTYASGASVDIDILSQGITLKNGTNSVIFTMSDGKRYKANVNYTTHAALPSSVGKATWGTDSSYCTITYIDGTTQRVSLTKYNSIGSASTTTVYFTGTNGANYYATLSGSSSGGSGGNSSQDEEGTIYYQISGVSYYLKGSKAIAANPVKIYGKKSVTVKATIKVDGKSYKVTKIDPLAFYGMKQLTKATIGKNVKTIGKKAFSGCSKLKTININSSAITSVGSSAFKGISKKATIKIKASKTKYKKIVKLIKNNGKAPSTVKYKRVS